MKNETARRELEYLDYYLQNYTSSYSVECHTAIRMGIDALNNDALNNAVLDKIRAEIEALITINSTSDYSNGVMNCLNIIDKYNVRK